MDGNPHGLDAGRKDQLFGNKHGKSHEIQQLLKNESKNLVLRFISYKVSSRNDWAHDLCVWWGRAGVDFNTKFEKSLLTMQRSRDVGEPNVPVTQMVLFLV